MGVKCRAVLDTMAGSSYISAGLLNYVGAKDFRVENREIEMMFETVRKKVKIYSLGVQNNNGDTVLEAEFSRVERDELLFLPNPKYAELKEKYQHLAPVMMDDTDNEKEMLPVHIIFGNNEYARVKTATAPLLG